jgi:long-chain fatty acid transport protein
VLLLLSSSTADAAGFYLSEVGTPASLGTAGAANVTNNFGPDAAWANPAGLTSVEDGAIVVGMQAIGANFEFDPSIAEAGGDDGGNAGSIAMVPSFFYHLQLNDKWHYGFGLSGLQGGGLDYGDDFVGRYGAKTVDLEALAATFSFGYQVTDRLSVGAGVSVVYTLFSEEIAINQGPLPDGQVKFDELDDWGVQPIIGLQYDLSERLLFGLSWRGEFDANLKGNAKFNTVAPLPARTNIEIDWTNPQWLEAGLRYTTTGGYSWMLSGTWQEWSEFSENQIAVDVGGVGGSTTLDRDWDDTWGASLGFGRLPGANVYGYGWSMGVGYESSPVDDDKRTIDMPMDETWKVSAALFKRRENKFDWSVGATLYVIGDNEIDQTAQGVRFTGDFDQYLLFLGTTFRF